MIDPELVAAAKVEIERMKLKKIIDNLPEEDRELMKKYPRHTLAAARLIDSAQAARPPLPDHVIHDCGQDFQYLQWQESGTPYTRQ
jgi:hypothetical protein